jgi:predicted PurR-regulated permease PerM
MSLKQIALNTAIVLGILTLAFLLWEFREAVIVFFFSLAVAAAARPYVEALSERGIPSGLAIVLVYLLFIIFLGIVFWAVGSPLVNEIQRLLDSLTRTYDQIMSTWPKGSQLQQMIVQQLPPLADLLKFFSPERASAIAQGALGFTLSSVALLAEVFTVLMLSIYWSIDRVHFERLWLSLLPVESRASARDIWRAIERDFGAYVRSEVLQSILAGILLGLGLWAMGVQYPTLLAVFGALVWLVPWLGGALAVLPVALTGLSQGLGIGIIATIFAIAVLILLEFVIEPRFIRRKQFSSLLSTLLIIALAAPFGLLGFFIAPPLAAAIELIFRYNLRTRPLPEEVKSVEEISVLRTRLAHIRETVARLPDPPEPQTLSLLERLDDLVNRSDKAIDEERPFAQRMTNRFRVIGRGVEK